MGSARRGRATWSMSCWAGRLGSHPRELGIQGVIAGLAIVYGVSTFVVHRPPSGYNTIWDGWIYTAAETLPVIPVLLRPRRSSELRSAWLAMAAMIVLNTLGDLVYTYHDQNLLPIPDPAPSDVLYLLSYGAFIVGVALLTQSSFGRVHASVRLDGAIAGLAMGAVAAMVWFGPLLRVGGRPLQVAVAMAYPLADLVLIVLLVAGLAPHRYRPNSSTVLLLAGVASFVLGDVIYMNRSVAGTYVAGAPLDETWIIGLCLVGLAASVRDRRRSWGPRRVGQLSGRHHRGTSRVRTGLPRRSRRCSVQARLAGGVGDGHCRPLSCDRSHVDDPARGTTDDRARDAPVSCQFPAMRAPTVSPASRTEEPFSTTWSRLSHPGPTLPCVPGC